MKQNQTQETGDMLSLETQSYSDLFHRARVSVIAYFVLFWLLAFMTPFFKDHRMLTLVFGVLVTLIVGFRLVLSLKFTPEKFEENPGKWISGFHAMALLSALLWGILNYIVLQLYGLLSSSSVYSLVMTCGIVGGGVNSLAPNFKLMKKFIILLILPASVWGAVNADYNTSFFMVLYMVLLLSVARSTSASYVASVTSNIQIHHQKKEIEKTVEAITLDSENLKGSSHDLSDIAHGMHSTSVDMSNRLVDIEKASGTIHTNAGAMGFPPGADAEECAETAGHRASPCSGAQGCASGERGCAHTS